MDAADDFDRAADLLERLGFIDDPAERRAQGRGVVYLRARARELRESDEPAADAAREGDAR